MGAGRARVSTFASRVWLFLALSACGSGTSLSPVAFDPMIPPTENPLLTLPSIAGAWRISVWTSPQPPQKGSDDVMYRVFDSAGLPVDGLTIQVTPWMTAHGHGTPVQPTVTPLGEGWYLVRPTYLYMAGRWDLRTSIEARTDLADGSSSRGDTMKTTSTDSAVPSVDIP
jgi:hypothetical protein